MIVDVAPVAVGMNPPTFGLKNFLSMSSGGLTGASGSTSTTVYNPFAPSSSPGGTGSTSGGTQSGTSTSNSGTSSSLGFGSLSVSGGATLTTTSDVSSHLRIPLNKQVILQFPAIKASSPTTLSLSHQVALTKTFIRLTSGSPMRLQVYPLDPITLQTTHRVSLTLRDQ
jgi:hypothetical protein